MRTLASDLARQIGEHVTVQGWLHNRRDLPNVTFLVIRERSGTAQVSVDPKQGASVPTIETAVEVRGMVVADQRAPGGAELREVDVRVLGCGSRYAAIVAAD
jgi:nondiscriminating aspartyl-tRNA synthetase